MNNIIIWYKFTRYSVNKNYAKKNICIYSTKAELMEEEITNIYCLTKSTIT